MDGCEQDDHLELIIKWGTSSMQRRRTMMGIQDSTKLIQYPQTEARTKER